VFSSLFFIILPNIEKYFPGIHFPWNSLSKKKLLSCKQTGPKTSLPYMSFVPSPIDSLHLHLSPAVDSSLIANNALILLSVTLVREA